jgi:hypothetical protein
VGLFVAVDMHSLLLLAAYCYCCVRLFVAVDMYSLLLLAAYSYCCVGLFVAVAALCPTGILCLS